MKKKIIFLIILLLIVVGTALITSKSSQTLAIASTSFTPTDDSYVYESNPTTNFGTNTSISVDGSPIKKSYLRFNVTNLPGTITKATLKIFANSSQPTGYNVYKVQDTLWSEQTINYSNAPALDTTITGSSGSVTSSTWTSVDITPTINGNGVVSLSITTTSSTNLNLASKESANPPQLIIETESATPEPTLNPTILPTILPTITPVITLTPIATSTPTATPTQTPTTTANPEVVIAAVGDMACGAGSTGASCKQMQVSDLILGINADAFLALGDIQYESGGYSDFVNYYHPSYGRLNSIVRPIIGNHEYIDPSTTNPTQVGYWNYFNGFGNQSGIAGDRSKGYYSFNLGDWHFIALNTNCSKIGGCGTGSPQELWLRADLAANTKPCTLAYYHHPLFSSGGRSSKGSLTLWKDLENSGADVILTGHDHTYERFANQNSNGVLDPNGIKQFVVGTGGRSHTHLAGRAANSEVFDDTSFGFLKMTLSSTGYTWQFIPIPGNNFTDQGSGVCHNASVNP